MIKVGLTGGIGSGKSTVAKIFSLLDIPVYYADAAARQLINEDPAVRASIIASFGNESYTSTGFNRQYISSVVFNDPAKLQLLNSITHPPVILHAATWMQQQTTSYIIKEAALIFESGSNKDLDYVIGVFAPKQLRVQRIIQRDGISSDEIVKRIESQMDEDEKMKLCDFVITNDEHQLVIPQVLSIHEELNSKFKSKK